MIERLLVLVGVLLPLGLDTFVLAAALGMAGLSQQRRLRTSLVLTAFEALMPIAGFLVGRGVGALIGRFAGLTAIAVLAIVGLVALLGHDRDGEERRDRLLHKTQGLAIVDLGLAVSIDELGVGFSLGLLGLSLPFAVSWIAAQAFVAAQLGMRLGGRVSEQTRDRSERFSGVLLIATALALLGLHFVRGEL